jgi:hypothetical protein
MAIQLSSAKSSRLQPKQKNQWVMQFARIPGDISGKSVDELSFVAHTGTKPQITFNEVQHHRMNEDFWVAGKRQWNSLSFSFYDFINGQDSAGNIMYNWGTKIHNPVTGQNFFKLQYTTAATLAQLDPTGAVIDVWNLFYIWPQDINWGDVSSEDDGIAEVQITFRYDYAIKTQEVDTTPSL